MLSNKGFSQSWHPRCFFHSRACRLSRVGAPGGGASGPWKLRRGHSPDGLISVDDELG